MYLKRHHLLGVHFNFYSLIYFVLVQQRQYNMNYRLIILHIIVIPKKYLQININSGDVCC